MEELLAKCVALDTAALEMYQQFGGLCDDPELKRVFERMGTEEWSHVEWWKELLAAYQTGRLVAISDEVALRAAVDEAETYVENLRASELNSLSADEMLEHAIRLEFFMLDPAFGELLDLLDPGASLHHRDAYSRHVMRLVSAIEVRHSDRGLASFLARVLARTYRDQERLTTLAARDSLTGLHNRRGFYNSLAQWCAWSARYGHSLGVLLVDVDHFKTVNDTFGHPAGDEVLCAIARALQRAVRETDLVGRYGGDEFAVLAPETSAFALEMLAERVLASVRECALDGTLAAVALSVSVGAAYAPEGAVTTPEILLSCADGSLYAAKDAGRDRVGPSVDVAVSGDCEPV